MTQELSTDLVGQALQVAENVLFVIPRSPRRPRDLLFFSTSKKQQIPRANPALRNDTLRVFPQPLQPVAFAVSVKTETRQSRAAGPSNR